MLSCWCKGCRLGKYKTKKKKVYVDGYVRAVAECAAEICKSVGKPEESVAGKNSEACTVFCPESKATLKQREEKKKRNRRG